MEAVRLEQNNETGVKAVKPAEVGERMEQGTIVSIGFGAKASVKADKRLTGREPGGQ